ncbi:G-type lectin S-receptor-like serine threonine-kinase At4g27290 [Olea europaea subsp. europaea]|uniref:G-type lectin S-receptor-like serine threonine-kinase At4g27290 n=1 Tax=Olea europaea subsp. europaea TaxID=158383 RepID=A0A8S0PRZ7_OLEEU|nr:G-type lectin S-receptor-like serine threonine-kinase At4g27290 [Olea europaea subsp. europaea]
MPEVLRLPGLSGCRALVLHEGFDSNVSSKMWGNMKSLGKMQYWRRRFCTSRDNITANLVIKDPETIVSKGQNFKLGFFSPNNSRRYLGIWYNQNVSEPTVVWVANRDKALNDSSGTVKIYKDGNIVVMNSDKEILWSSNVKNTKMNTTAQLLDSGNLVLIESSSGREIWESFKQPSGSFLTAIKLSRSINVVEKATTSCGNGMCGPFGICDSQNSHICTCLEGFYPKDDGEWKAENWTSGCVRRIHLQCETNNGSNSGRKEDRFLKLEMMKVPDYGDRQPGQKSKCEGLCMKNRSCIAYALDVGIGCLFWTGSLINIQKFSADNFRDANKLGKGGFGPVYKVIFRPSPSQVSVFMEFRSAEIVAPI